MYMSREEILRVYDAGPEAVVALVQELCSRLTKLENRVQHLEDIVKKNSRNSSRPPSSDGYQKPSPKSLRKRSGKKSGGQEGHPGKTLQKTEEPDKVVLHPVHACEQCGRSLLDEPVPILKNGRSLIFRPLPSR